MLEKLGACRSGIDDFVRITGGVYEAEWTLDEQLRIIKSDLRKWFMWAVIHGLLPLLSMSEVDLSGADLFGANISKADLREADLSRASLSGANLREADLSLADLSRAYLRYAITDKYTKFPNEFDVRRLK